MGTVSWFISLICCRQVSLSHIWWHFIDITLFARPCSIITINDSIWKAPYSLYKPNPDSQYQCTAFPLPSLNSLPQLAQFNPHDCFFVTLPPLCPIFLHPHCASFFPSLPFALWPHNLWPSLFWCWSPFIFLHPCPPSLLHPSPSLFKAPVADTLSALEQHMTLLAVILSLAAVPKLSKALLRMMRSCCVPSKSQLIALAPDHVTPVDDSCQI